MPTSIKFLSLNVSVFDENNEKLTAFLTKESPDIVCLQEVTRKVDDSAHDAIISKGTIDHATPQLPYAFFAPNWAWKDFRQENFHGKALFAHDFGGVVETGNYTKSTFPMSDAKSVFMQGNFSFFTDWEEFAKHPGEEPRNVAVSDIQIGTQNLRILNYHGIWSKDKMGTERTKAASRKLLELAEEVDYPTIICGDFNLFPDTESIHLLTEKFISLVDTYNIMYTRPQSNELSSAKRNVVDYIFIDKRIQVKKFDVLDTDTSDHLPLIMECEI